MNSSEQLVGIYSRIMTQFKAGFSDAITIFHVEHRPDKDARHLTFNVEHARHSTLENTELLTQKRSS